MSLTLILGLVVLGILIISILCAFSWYRIVDPSEAHVVVSGKKKMVCSPDPNLAGIIVKDENTKKSILQNTGNAKASYFDIPILRTVRKIDVTIREIVTTQETYEKDQARFNVSSSTKYRVVDVAKAVETFKNYTDLDKQLKEIIEAGVREVTVKYDVVTVRAKKELMSQEVFKSLEGDFQQWGLELKNFVLVDFSDTGSGEKDSKIITDISRRREVEIEAETREMNAEKYKSARVKEAEAEETAKKREIEKDEEVAKREQVKAKLVSEQEKDAKEREYDVIKVKTVRQAEIDKEKAIVDANKEKEVEMVNKEKKRLDGEGEKLRLEEVAKGNAAKFREDGLAQAEAKEKLQEALNKFGDDAIRALVAEKIVEAQKEIGVELAKSLAKADVKVFAGDGSAKDGFDMGKMLEAMNVSNSNMVKPILNRLARPNDLGLESLKLDLGKENLTSNKNLTK